MQELTGTKMKYSKISGKEIKQIVVCVEKRVVQTGNNFKFVIRTTNSMRTKYGIFTRVPFTQISVNHTVWSILHPNPRRAMKNKG